MSSQQASQSCLPCRRLKRKCTRELPSCSMCTRLVKPCEYSDLPKIHRAGSKRVTGFVSQSVEGSGQQLEMQFSENSNQAIAGLLDSDSPQQVSAPALRPPAIRPAMFPATYFLDSDSHYQVPSDRRDPGVPVPTEILDVLSSRAAMNSICDGYLRNTHGWLPMLSQKRLFQKVNDFSADADIGLSLLLLCMKLVSKIPSPLGQAAISPLYCMAKELYSRVESACLISLQLLQSAILIAIYEIGHGIYPAAYLRVGNAARLGVMMGLHDRKNATQLFKEADTWSQCEEERRTWWAVVILDRYVNLGLHGVHLATPDPLQGNLLPCSESHWDLGEIGSNEPLFASSFATSTYIGYFARTCQASHILGLVIRHRDDRSNSTIDPRFRLSEAQQLHQTLVALSTHLTENPRGVGNKSNTEVGIALCCSARIILYGMYACNEDYTANRPRLAEESAMQRTSLEGLKEVTNIVYQLTQRISHAAMTTDHLSLSRHLLVCHCLYEASSECAWFIREDNNLEGVACLKAMVELSKSIGTKWLIAEEYLKSFEAEGALAVVLGE